MASWRNMAYLGILLAGSGCATRGVPMRVLEVPPVPLFAYGRIEVGTFEGPEKAAAALATELEQALERRLSEPEVRRWFPAGDETGSRIILRGDVLEHEIREDVSQEGDQEEEGEKGRHSAFGPRGRMAVRFEAVKASTEETIDAVVIEESGSQLMLDLMSARPPNDETPLLARLRARVVKTYLRRILPSWHVVHTPLFTEDDLPALDAGNEHVQAGEWRRAEESYLRALSRTRTSGSGEEYKPLYNLGVLYTYTNRFEEAREALESARGVRRESRITDAIETLESRRAAFGRYTAERARLLSRFEAAPLPPEGPVHRPAGGVVDKRPESGLPDAFEPVTGPHRPELAGRLGGAALIIDDAGLTQRHGPAGRNVYDVVDADRRFAGLLRTQLRELGLAAGAPAGERIPIPVAIRGKILFRVAKERGDRRWKSIQSELRLELEVVDRVLERLMTVTSGLRRAFGLGGPGGTEAAPLYRREFHLTAERRLVPIQDRKRVEFEVRREVVRKTLEALFGDDAFLDALGRLGVWTGPQTQ